MSRSNFAARRYTKARRRGATLILVLFLMVMMLACVAFCLDLGYLAMARTELQRSADSAAMAAAWELIDESSLTGELSESAMAAAREKAKTYAGQNSVCRQQPDVAENLENQKTGDILIGTLWDFRDRSEEIKTEGESGVASSDYNVVRVRVRRTAEMNGNVPFFFAPVLGINGRPAQAEATVGLVKSIAGFTAPSDGSNINILPFALDLDSWNEVLAKQTSDRWKYDPETRSVTPGSDGVHEVNLYPDGSNKPSGNRGTLDIGGSDNSTSDIARQIVDGVSSEDLAYHGGALEFDANGEISLNGDTGISAGIKEELALSTVIGRPSIIPIFSEVQSPGNNAQYTIVMFAGVRILHVRLTGTNTNKHVIIQPSNVVTKGVIPAPIDPGGGRPSSYYVYSYPILVR